jgi:hypothetical protein
MRIIKDNFIESQEQQFALRIDDQSVAGVAFIGKAPLGSLPSAAVWQIKKIDETGSVLIINWADGDSNFDNIWNDRVSLTYS